MARLNGDTARLDDAARAGWLYYVAGNTQDQIARKLGVSRQSAQRLVSMAVSERLIKFRLDHPLAQCMDLGHRLEGRFDLRFCQVAPSDPDAPGLMAGVASVGAAEMEKHLRSRDTRIIALGTGRALRACVEQLPEMDCSQHQIVSLLGNMMSDGSATPYNAVIRLAERANARHYPMPLPVLARDTDELHILHRQVPVANTLALCREADVTFVGIGNIDIKAPLVIDGFLSPAEVAALESAGAVGEIISWVYDAAGNLLRDPVNQRVLSAPLMADNPRPVVGIALGLAKVPAIIGAVRGKLINALITDERTASAVLGATEKS